jgi:uncharacterized membrane protein
MEKKHEKLFRTILWIGVIILIITLLVSAIIRITDLMASILTRQMPFPGSIEYGYAQKPMLTLLHILPGMIFLVLGAMQFVKRIRMNYINFHRWSGRIYLVLGMIIGFSAIIMSFTIRFGGYIETSAVTIFGSFFLFSLVKAFLHIKKKEFVQHREWMIRAYAIGLAVASMRPLIGLFFAFTDMKFKDFFGIIFWIAFILHALVAELWIRYTRKKV